MKWSMSDEIQRLTIPPEMLQTEKPKGHPFYRFQCTGCGRFVKAKDVVWKTGPTFDLCDWAHWTCTKCGPMAEPMT